MSDLAPCSHDDVPPPLNPTAAYSRLHPPSPPGPSSPVWVRVYWRSTLSTRPVHTGRGSGSPVGSGPGRASSQHRPQPRHWDMRVYFMVGRPKATLSASGMAHDPAHGRKRLQRQNAPGPARTCQPQIPLASPNTTSGSLWLAAKPVLNSGRVTRATTARSCCLCRRCQCFCARPTE